MIELYLHGFFQALERLSPKQPFYSSHAIAYEDNSLYLLFSVGDFRVRIRVQELDPDPVEAAAIMYRQWKSMDHDEIVTAVCY